MNIIRLISGMLFFEEFDSTQLDSRWTVTPNDALRYSLVERPGFLKMFHGIPDLYLLTIEPDNYVVDIKNEYVPINNSIHAGICAYKTMQSQLEVSEYYDETQDAAFVYQFIRLEKDGNVYTAYGKNLDQSSWELVASCEFKSSGKFGMSLKGPQTEGASDYNLDYFRVYKNHTIQILNVPLDYTIHLVDETDSVIGTRRVSNTFSGVSFETDKIPPFVYYFRVYDTNGVLVCTSTPTSMCGGDIYFYGAVPMVSIDGNSLYQDTDYFLGYFTNTDIPFKIDISNPYSNEFNSSTLSAIQYLEDEGYKCVRFSSTLDGEYTNSIVLPVMTGNSSISVYGKITRDSTVLERTGFEPFRFNLSITY